jgi:hypothetical protein
MTATVTWTVIVECPVKDNDVAIEMARDRMDDEGADIEDIEWDEEDEEGLVPK